MLLRTSHRLAVAVTAVGLFAYAAAPAGAADVVVKMADLAIRPATYVGDHVVIPDCFMIAEDPLIGAQCSINPIDSTVLVYVDSDTWSDQARKIANDCETAILEQMCTLRVTGEVTLNRRGQAMIINAVLQIVKRPQQAI